MNGPTYPGGWAPPPPARNNNVYWIVGIVGLLLIAGGVVLTLWLTGVFDRGSGSSTANVSVAAAPAAPAVTAPSTRATPAPVPAPAPVAGGTSCPNIVSADDPAAASPAGNVNRLVVAGQNVTWNGTAIDPPRLRQYLDLTKTLNPQPTLVTSAGPGANAVVVQRVLEVIAAGTGCRPARL